MGIGIERTARKEIWNGHTKPEKYRRYQVRD